MKLITYSTISVGGLSIRERARSARESSQQTTATVKHSASLSKLSGLNRSKNSAHKRKRVTDELILVALSASKTSGRRRMHAIINNSTEFTNYTYMQDRARWLAK